MMTETHPCSEVATFAAVVSVWPEVGLQLAELVRAEGGLGPRGCLQLYNHSRLSQ